MDNRRIYIQTGPLTREQQEEIRKQSTGEIQILSNGWLVKNITGNPAKEFYQTTFKLYNAKVTPRLTEIEGVEGIRYPVETIEDMDLLKEEIEYETASFDLDRFYDKEPNRAVCVITEDETYFAYAWEDHGNATARIYDYLYNDTNQMKDWDFIPWQYNATERGNVIIQFCSDISTPIWLPSSINDYQYNKVMELLTQLEQIDQRSKNNLAIGIDLSEDIPIQEAKERLNSFCREKGIYTPPKTK